MEKNYLRLTAAALASVMLISVCGCSDKTSTGTKDKKSNGNNTSVSDVIDNGGKGTEENGTGEESPSDNTSPLTYSENPYRNFQLYTNFEDYVFSEHLDPKQIYDNLTYSPQMFYGNYIKEDLMDKEDRYISSTSDLFKSYAASAKYMTLSLDDKYNEGETYDIEVGTLPIEFSAGNHSGYSLGKLRKISKYNWISFTVPKKSGDDYYPYEMTGAYYIDGHKLVFTPLTNIEYNEDYTEVVEYNLSDKNIEFEFEFTGGRVTLTNSDGDSVTLDAKRLTETYHNMSINCYAASDDNTIDDICGFNLAKFMYSDEINVISMVYLENEDDDYYFKNYPNLVAHFNENGIMNFSWAEIDGTPHVYEFVYFFCGDDGLILTDGTNTYKYTASYSDYQLGADVETTNEETLGKLDQGKVAAIADKKKNLMEELMAAFEKEGISVEANNDTGEIMMDSSVLFGVDQYEITESGQEFLKKFIKAYSSVILKDDYDGFVSKIMVEGHTDSTGERSHNEELSNKRAEEVMKYCLSDKAGIDKSVKEDMSKLMEAIGYADDYPIFDESGKEDQAKSRRVSFKFVIDMENAAKLDSIEQREADFEE